jgi:hypothetical protein
MPPRPPPPPASQKPPLGSHGSSPLLDGVELAGDLGSEESQPLLDPQGCNSSIFILFPIIVLLLCRLLYTR